jgi:hypothetical protein
MIGIAAEAYTPSQIASYLTQRRYIPTSASDQSWLPEGLPIIALNCSRKKAVQYQCPKEPYR